MNGPKQTQEGNENYKAILVVAAIVLLSLNGIVQASIFIKTCWWAMLEMRQTRA